MSWQTYFLRQFSILLEYREIIVPELFNQLRWMIFRIDRASMNCVSIHRCIFSVHLIETITSFANKYFLLLAYNLINVIRWGDQGR